MKNKNMMRIVCWILTGILVLGLFAGAVTVASAATENAPTTVEVA